MPRGEALIGCASWSLPKLLQPEFAEGASHLARFATRLNAAEINSSFHRPHSPATYARWAEGVPDGFRFCVKLPKTVTHGLRLVGSEALLDEFLLQARGLGERLACLLVQLPPSFAFDLRNADAFFAALRQRWTGRVALEPRHVSWFAPEADVLLAHHRIARVLADPVRCEGGEGPGGSAEFIYLRLHGSPRMYYSSYEPELISALARRLAVELRGGRDVWCIFDNTASGAAAHNALALGVALGKAD